MQNANRLTRVAAALFAAFTCLSASAGGMAMPAGCELAGRQDPGAALKASPASVFPPLQIQMRTPVVPTLYASGGRQYLMYELHLLNFSGDPMAVRAIEVLGVDQGREQAMATIGEEKLNASMRRVAFENEGEYRTLGPGQTSVAFLCLAFDAGATPPTGLRHRLLLDRGVADGPPVAVRRVSLPVFGAPMRGGDWHAFNGPGIYSHHRMGLFVSDGQQHLSRRFAIDWRKTRDGVTFSGDARDVHAYFSYGEMVLAVADGVVVSAMDGLPDNIPRTPAGFDTAIPLTMETVSGNAVVLDVGSGQFATYAHLKPGSVRVRRGDHVKRGQLLAQIGNSGDAREPHLHFQLTDAPGVFSSEGLPYLIDRYRATVDGGTAQERRREFPVADAAIDFGGAPRNEK